MKTLKRRTPPTVNARDVGTRHQQCSCPQKAADGRDSGGHGAKLEAVRERALVALLTEKTIGKAASTCGIGERTLRRWMADDEEFKRELSEARHTMFQASLHRVQALATVAIDTFEVLMGVKMPPNVRLGAARTVAELGLHTYDAETITRRLDDIEARQRELAAQERS